MRPTVVSFYTVGTPYEQAVEVLRKSCEAHGYKHDIQGIPDAGSWAENCNQKAGVVREAIRKHGKILYLDANMEIQKEIPFFDGNIRGVALHVVDYEDLRPGLFSNRYRYHIRKYGMWNSGIMLWGQGSLPLAEAWEEMCLRRPTEWDQLNLQCAHREMQSPIPVGQIPESYRAGKGRIGNYSGFHAHWKQPGELPRRNVLLLGSGSCAPEWWSANREAYLNQGYQIVAVNNACAIPGDDLHLWIHPNDYSGSFCAPLDVPTNRNHHRATNKAKNFIMAPHCVERNVRTVAFDAIVHLLNEAILDKCRLTLHLVGLDMDYDSSKTHFYGNGAQDPLRHGDEAIRSAQQAILGWFKAHNSRILNAGGQERTRLIFPRADGP